MTKQLPTSDENKRLIMKTLDKIQDQMVELYDRWQDEKEYENIKSYGDILAKALPKQFSFVKMTKSPFALHFAIGDQVGYQFYVRAGDLGWRRKFGGK